MKLIRFLVMSALILFVGLPVAFILFVMAMAAFGVVLGIGGALIGLMFAVIKVALIVALVLGVLWWVGKKLLAPERVY